MCYPDWKDYDYNEEAADEYVDAIKELFYDTINALKKSNLIVGQFKISSDPRNKLSFKIKIKPHTVETVCIFWNSFNPMDERYSYDKHYQVFCGKFESEPETVETLIQYLTNMCTTDTEHKTPEGWWDRSWD